MLNYFVNDEDNFYNVYTCMHVYNYVYRPTRIVTGISQEVGITLSYSGTLTFPVPVEFGAKKQGRSAPFPRQSVQW